jgi:hypothetical protein
MAARAMRCDPTCRPGPVVNVRWRVRAAGSPRYPSAQARSLKAIAASDGAALSLASPPHAAEVDARAQR